MPAKRKSKQSDQQKALIKVLVILLFAAGAIIALIVWASQEAESELAAKIRQIIGISLSSDDTPAPATPEPAPAPIVETPTKPVEVQIKLEALAPPPPPPKPTIDLATLAETPSLWPQNLELNQSKQVEIRYNGNTYGYVEFNSDSVITVKEINSSGEILGTVNSNFLSLAPYETNLLEWLDATYGDSYQFDLDPNQRLSLPGDGNLPNLSTEEGQTDFWSEMRIWCYRNYESASISQGEDNLIFKWLPKENSPIDFQLEAREIARFYLLQRAARGGHENYAGCEIRDPHTNELLGSAAIFIPRLK